MASSDFTVSVDLGSLGVNDQLSPKIVEVVENSIRTSLALVRDRWQTEVQNTLTSARPLYLQGLQFDSVMYPYESPLSGAVVLKGNLPNMLESGFS